MELIIQKSIKYSVNDFFNKIIYLDYIDGIALNIFKTKDNVLITFNLINNQESLLQNIYNSNYENLQNLEVIKLEIVINYLESINYSKKVYLNLVPFRQLQLTEEQNKVLMLEYEKYANNLADILKNSKLNLYLHSVSRDLLDIVRTKEIDCQFGFAIVGYDLNYIDVNYYVFTVEMLNFPLIKQELDLKKKVVIYIGNDYEMSLVYDLLLGSKKDKLANYIKDKISLMGNYPDLLQKTFLN